MNNEKDKLYSMCRASIDALEELWEMIERSEMKNEQFVLDWLDQINAISIRN